MPTPDHDILIVGAGISGISMAAHLQKMCRHLSFQIIERRAQLGGTWDLFRYPGVRSDSDMHTLGFAFAPWRGAKAIADGEDILSYLNRVVEERGITPHISFGSTVVTADWKAAEALWHVTIEDADGWRTQTARFVYFAAGYYDYDNAHEADIPGLGDFGGEVLHPQFWPQDADYAGKRAVVIGSGATAVTVVPAMAQQAEHVTMLQRTPTWMLAQPSRDKWADRLRKVLPEQAAYNLTRFLNTRISTLLFRRSQKKPHELAAYLTKKLKKELGAHYSEEHFLPPYDPWNQRLCLVPDGDLFAAIREGSASISTGHIEQVQADGILLTDGRHIPADTIVTATGLKMMLGGHAQISIDGQDIRFADRWFYRSCMFSNLPNLAVVFGYLNASWTLRADMTAQYCCRVLAAMEAKSATIATPVREEDQPEKAVDPSFGFSSGYIKRAASEIPHSEAYLPWRLNMDFLEDRRDLKRRPIDDGILAFSNADDSPGEDCDKDASGASA